MLNSNTIKAQVRKEFTDVEIVEVKKHSFGLFVVKVKKEMARSTKTGLVFGSTDFDARENGVKLEKKVSWS
tara:strand:- start:607 stop:819 length:213 start_codon:yes stop_codon:yes gene_type:complete